MDDGLLQNFSNLLYPQLVKTGKIVRALPLLAGSIISIVVTASFPTHKYC